MKIKMYGGVSSDLLPFIFREGGVVCVFQVVEQCLLVITSLSEVSFSSSKISFPWINVV